MTVALVYGLGVAGAALGDALHRRGVQVLAGDDRAAPASAAHAERWATDLVAAPDEATLRRVVDSVDLVCPAPGVPEHHALIRLAHQMGKPLCSEIELAYSWEQQRPGGPRPMLGITGTDGKTTTTLMATAMLQSGGLHAVAVGNTEVPLAAEIDGDADVFVVECSSFRLQWTGTFRCESSVWLNLADDHQNWHSSMAAYEAAKARLWAHNRPTDTAVGFADDPVVMRNLARSACRHRTFAASGADYFVAGGSLVGPRGPICDVSSLSRRLPHDLTNALAAAAVCLESGLTSVAAIATALGEFRHPPHRIEPVAEADGVAWFNDSKATTPHAALTAIRSFERIVLLAGGRNKDLDLASLATEAPRMRAVVALGEAAPIIEQAFRGRVPTVRAGSMAEAVDAARQMAKPGDTVLMSPACASFDWYPDGGYPARGDHFKELVLQAVQQVHGVPE
jgi:UDP-N-acetylmuramoylalanine--D-glutamate ligase